MKFTITFYDDFDHVKARAEVAAEDEMAAISEATITCQVDIRNVGLIRVESPDREWLRALDQDSKGVKG